MSQLGANPVVQDPPQADQAGAVPIERAAGVRSDLAVVATLLGFLLGIMRLSRNWLVARLAAAYIEIVRNLPLLLQLFFWYFAILRQLPGPRQSASLLGAVFLNNRGLFSPRPIPEPGFPVVLLALPHALCPAAS